MIEITDYKHIVQYYETDKMGVAHHSNYIRWMEEARVDFLEQTGWSYARLEEAGVISYVVNINCDFKHPTHFSDTVYILANITELRGVTLKFSYEMKNGDGTLVCTGTSTHAFFSAEGKPVRVKRDYPELYETLSGLVKGEETA